MDFKHTAALITGGSSGIGLALAHTLAGQGTQVALLARRIDGLQTALASLPTSPSGPHMLQVADVSDPQQAQQAVDAVMEQFKRIDLLVNSAGVVHPGYVEELDLERFRWMMDINYFGTVYMTRAALPGMMARHAGYIVNIGSFVSRVSVIGYSAYAPSKFAVRGFTDALRMEMKPHGINVSIVYPPDTDTPQLAYENLYKPEELKNLLPEFGVVTPEKVAQAIMSGIQRRRYEIIPDFGSKVLLYLDGVAGGMRYAVLDWLAERARRKSTASRQ